MNKKAFLKPSVVLIIIAFVFLIKYMGSGSIVSHPITFEFKGMQGVGTYQTAQMDRKQGNGDSSLKVEQESILIKSSSSGDSYGAPSVYAEFDITLGALYNFCVKGNVQRARRDDSAGSSLSICADSKCVEIYIIKPVTNSGGWETYKCFTMDIEGLNNQHFLVINDGSETKKYQGEEWKLEKLRIYASTSSSADYHSGSSSSLLVENFVLISQPTIQPDILSVIPGTIYVKLPVESFFDKLWQFFIDLYDSVFGSIKIERGDIYE